MPATQSHHRTRQQTIVAAPEQIETMMLYEYEEVGGFDFGSYVSNLSFAKSLIAKKLGFTTQQLQGWIDRRRLPRCVWRRMCQEFGRGVVRGDPKVCEVRKPYRVPASQYAYWLHVTIKPPVVPQPPVKLPEPTPRPDNVSFAIHEHTVMLMMHQNQSLAQEVTALNVETLRQAAQIEALQNHLAIVTGEKQFNITSKALDTVRPIRVDKESPVHKETMRLLDTMKPLNGNGEVLSDLERRIRPLQVGPQS